MNDWNKSVIEEFRTNEGKVAAFGNGLLLLHTKGAKSGAERINPVAYFKDGDRYVVIASKGGADTSPDWYYNVLANPDTSIEVGTEQFPTTAKAAPEPERTELFDKMAAINPGFAEYKVKTSRIIPVVVLTRK